MDPRVLYDIRLTGSSSFPVSLLPVLGLSPFLLQSPLVGDGALTESGASLDPFSVGPTPLLLYPFSGEGGK